MKRFNTVEQLVQMKMSRRIFQAIFFSGVVWGLSACGQSAETSSRGALPVVDKSQITNADSAASQAATQPTEIVGLIGTFNLIECQGSVEVTRESSGDLKIDVKRINPSICNYVGVFNATMFEKDTSVISKPDDVYYVSGKSIKTQSSVLTLYFGHKKPYGLSEGIIESKYMRIRNEPPRPTCKTPSGETTTYCAGDKILAYDSKASDSYMDNCSQWQHAKVVGYTPNQLPDLGFKYDVQFESGPHAGQVQNVGKQEISRLAGCGEGLFSSCVGERAAVNVKLADEKYPTVVGGKIIGVNEFGNSYVLEVQDSYFHNGLLCTYSN